MPRSSTSNLAPFVRAVACPESLKATSDRLPSARESQRLSARMRELEKQVRKLNLRTTSLGTGTRKRGRGRPRVNPVTCKLRGCKEPARAKKMCSRHYQAARLKRLARKK